MRLVNCITSAERKGEQKKEQNKQQNLKKECLEERQKSDGERQKTQAYRNIRSFRYFITFYVNVICKLT